jgi:hypothetical protein
MGCGIHLSVFVVYESGGIPLWCGLTAVGIDTKDWTSYWLRHSFGTYALETLRVEESSVLMGNGVAVLRRHYLHPNDETLYRSAENVQKKLNSIREK